MYLKSVLDSIAKRRSYTAEDLYKLNEAVFNLPDGEVVNPKTTDRLFTTLGNIMRAYNDGHSQAADPNFFYDYVALLATMQNQHFLDDRQNRRICQWLYEALGHELGTPAVAQAGKGKGGGKDNNAAALRELAKLEAENEALKKELEQLRTLSTAIAAFKAFKPLQAEKTAEPKAKAKAKAKKSKDKKDTEDKDGEEEEAKDGEGEKGEE